MIGYNTTQNRKITSRAIISALGAIPYVAIPDRSVGLSEMNVPGGLE